MNQARTKVISMNPKQTYMDILQNQKGMFHNFQKVLFDPAGLLGASGTLLLSITSIMEEIPAVYPGLAGAALVLVSVWQKWNQTRRENEEARRKALNYIEKQRILKLFETGEMDQEIASFMLKHLEDE